jgi:hypothetical protein
MIAVPHAAGQEVSDRLKAAVWMVREAGDIG